MASSNDQKFRGACENCHRRKIRCVLPKGETACQTCALHGTRCLFAPRGKPGRVPSSGRVPKDTTQYVYHSVTQDHNSSSGSGSSSTEPDASQTSVTIKPSSIIPSLEDAVDMEIGFSSSSDLDENSTSPINSDVATVWNPRALESVPGAMTGLDYFTTLPDIPSSTNHGLMSPPASIRSNELFDGIVTRPLSSASIKALDSPLLGVPGLSDYHVMLDACQRMNDFCSGYFSDLPYLKDDLFDLLLRICSGAAKTGNCSQQTPAMEATAAMRLATLHKVIECIDTLVRKLVAQPVLHPGGKLEEMLALKKADLVLLQARIALVKEKRGLAVQKAVELQNSIRSLLDGVYPGWT